MADNAQESFEQRLGSLLSKKTEGGETTTLINKHEVEEIGGELGMSSAQASTQFFALQGFVWDVADMNYSLIDSSESRGLPPPRNWLAINDIYLVT